MDTDQFIQRVIVPQHNKEKESHLSYLWYRGTKDDGSYNVFSMVKNVDPKVFKSYITQEGFVDITGPWNNETETTSRLKR